MRSPDLTLAMIEDRRTQVYFHPDDKLVYLAHPRTASNATVAFLKTVGFQKALHPSVADHHAQLGPPVTIKNRYEWRVATTVRNPLDTVVSWMFHEREFPEIPFGRAEVESTLDNIPQYVTEDRLFSLHSDDADFIMRYETLEVDLAMFLDMDSVELPRVNESKKRKLRSYGEYLTQEAAEYVGGRFAVETARFGYYL